MGGEGIFSRRVSRVGLAEAAAKEPDHGGRRGRPAACEGPQRCPEMQSLAGYGGDAICPLGTHNGFRTSVDLVTPAKPAQRRVSFTTPAARDTSPERTPAKEEAEDLNLEVQSELHARQDTLDGVARALRERELRLREAEVRVREEAIGAEELARDHMTGLTPPGVRTMLGTPRAQVGLLSGASALESAVSDLHAPQRACPRQTQVAPSPLPHLDTQALVQHMVTPMPRRTAPQRGGSAHFQIWTPPADAPAAPPRYATEPPRSRVSDVQLRYNPEPDPRFAQAQLDARQAELSRWQAELEVLEGRIRHEAARPKFSSGLPPSPVALWLRGLLHGCARRHGGRPLRFFGLI